MLRRLIGGSVENAISITMLLVIVVIVNCSAGLNKSSNRPVQLFTLQFPPLFFIVRLQSVLKRSAVKFGKGQ